MSNRHKRAKRACDLCRQRKVRCDGEPNSNCSQCSSKGQNCTWASRQNKRGRKPSTTKSTTNKKSLKRKVFDSPSPNASPKVKRRRKDLNKSDEDESSISDLLVENENNSMNNRDKSSTHNHPIKPPPTPHKDIKIVKQEYNNFEEEYDSTFDMEVEDEIDFVKNSPPMNSMGYYSYDLFTSNFDDLENLALSSTRSDEDINNLKKESEYWKKKYHQLLDQTAFDPTSNVTKQLFGGIKANRSIMDGKYFLNYPHFLGSNTYGVCVSLFLSYVKPMFPNFGYIYDVERTRTNWNSLVFDFKVIHYSPLKLDQWVSLAKDCLVFVCGARMLSLIDISVQLMMSLETMLNLIFTRFSLPSTMIDNLINMWMIKTLFYIGTDDKVNLSNSIISLYKLSTTYSEYILPSTKHKILSIMILLPENDCITWLDHINKLGNEACGELINLVMISSLLNMRCCGWNGSWDEITLNPNENNNSPIASITLQYLEKADNSINDNQNKYPVEMINFLKTVIYTSKATILLLTNKQQDSLHWATKALHLSKNSIFPVHCLLNSISPLISIFKTLSQGDLEQEAKAIYKYYKRAELENSHMEVHTSMHMVRSEDVMFPLMKIDHTDYYGIDISDITFFESSSFQNISMYDSMYENL